MEQELAACFQFSKTMSGLVSGCTVGWVTTLRPSAGQVWDGGAVPLTTWPPVEPLLWPHDARLQ